MKKRKPAEKSKWYVEPEHLRTVILDMQARNDGMTDEFARIILLIQEKVLTIFPRFKCYPEEVKQSCRDENIMKWAKRGWMTIDADKNPFSYIT